MQAFEQFLKYKLRIPVRGAIMLNEAMDSAVLVKGWKKGANWSFPRGKINKDEDDLTCAIREVYEETGYDLEAAGLVPADRNVKYIDITIRDQDLRLYVFRGVPTDTHFEPKTRKEISKIQWWRISDLPSFHKKGHQQQAEAAVNANKFYMVAPFIRSVRKWATEQKNRDSARTTSNQYLAASVSHDEFMTEEEQGAESNTQDQLYMNPTVPNINQLETALRTALKIQPPTQGLQLEAISAIQSPVRDSGQELLALLQGKGRQSKQALQSNIPPQTPLDHIITQAPVPRTPHHQQPRPPVFHNPPPLPIFPAHLRAGLSNLPAQASRTDTFSDVPPHPALPAHLRDSLPHPGSNQQPRHHPISTDPFQQGQIPGERQPEPVQKHPHSHQAQHLVHPQPLPPQVQRAVFTGGPLYSSMNPQPPQQPVAPHLSSTSSQAVNPLFPNNTYPLIPPSTQKQPPPKLTNHSLALLNAFKSHDQTAEKATLSSDHLLQGVGQERHAPPQELPAEVSGAPPVDLLSLFKVQQPESSPPVHTTATLAKPPVNDAHRASLLDLFKGPSKASLSPRPAAATAFPSSTTPSAVELSAVEPLSSNAVPPSTSVIDGQDGNIREGERPSIPELHPESNLPFRAMSILSRPSQANGADRRGNASVHETRSNGVNTTASQTRIAPPKPSAEKPFQPRILKRPQPSTSKPAEPPIAAPSNPAALPMVTSFDRRGSQTADHKQTLLSLFGKTPSPPAPLTQDQTDGSFASLHTVGQTNAPAKTRVGSLVSEDTSRRGSQDALSPADKSFLLSYLDNVAKGTHL
jgi:mRNA-decapping enzyme subunit 2